MGGKVSRHCSKCGENTIIPGDIGLRTSKDMELIMVVRKYHGIEKKVPLFPQVCGKCGFVDFYVEDYDTLKVNPEDRPIDPTFRRPPLQEFDF
ncbi:MAG: hypothetical protein COV67_11390 [Nitrospinae bacterium CG11_big_fil_rev_8_21_14_0_20_56_8]|nr:MAG: hypothetical protein COV67_11390 [Nitrospinae bacterium CG11_big_fil_rev_8_21_14_0_20_56_8]